MHWPHRSTTPALLILPVRRDAHGVYALYCEDAGRAGITVATQARVYLRDQVFAVLRAQLGNDCSYEPQVNFYERGELCGEQVSAMIVSVHGTVSSMQTGGFRNFAEVVRALRKDRDRLIYLKAWQFLAGMDEVRAKVSTTKSLLE